MKKTTIKLHANRILELKLLEDGTYDVLLEVEEEESDSAKNDTKPVFSDSDFVLIEAESLSMDDEFMQYEPKNTSEAELKELISKAIKHGVKNFYCLNRVVDFAADDENVRYVIGKKSIINKNYYWHEEAAKKLMPERNSRLGSIMEYGAFLGVLIKTLAEEAFTICGAWDIVYSNSIELLAYWNCVKSTKRITSKSICGFFNLLGTETKMLKWDDEFGVYFYVWGCYDKCDLVNIPFSCVGEVDEDFCGDDDPRNSVLDDTMGWIVFS